MARRRTLGWIALGMLAAVVGACSSDGEGTTGNTTPPDPGPDLLAHCKFEDAPERAAKAPNAPTEILAGYGEAVLPIPIGAPLGGYASRTLGLGSAKPVDDRARRFGKSLVPTVGVHDAPRAQAIALEAGGERMVLVRVDAPLLNENTLYELESKVAPDGSMRGRIIMTASHSHAAWAGYQPSVVLMPGVDRPKKALAERAVEGMAAAVKGALDSLAPARIGVAVDKAFDPSDEVNRDRRGENNEVLGPDGNDAGKSKDPTLWALRIDKADGTPLAALVDLPIHGTIGGEDNPLVSTDAPGAVARALSAELGYPVLHVQGAAGDVSPAGHEGRKACADSLRCLDIPRLEALGARAAELIAPFIGSIQTGDKAALEIVTRSFYVGRDAVVKRPDGTELRYAPVDPELEEPDGVLLDENGRVLSPIDEFNTAYGAGLCGEDSGSIAPIPNTLGIKAYGSCLELEKGRNIVFGLFDMVDVPVPLCDTMRTTAAAVRITGTPSGDWLMLTMPGEAVAPFASYLRGRSPAGADRTLLVGYGDDHVGYLLTGEDWLAGGYEPSINIWGPLEGEIIIDGILEAAKLAWTPEIEDPEKGSSRYAGWKYPDEAPITPLVTSDHGGIALPSATMFWPDTASKDVPLLAPTVPRAVGAERFAWFGGDPAIDMPLVTIQRELDASTYVPLLDAKGREWTSYDGAIVVTYTPDPVDAAAPEHHIYTATWQPVPPDLFTASKPEQPFSLPLGRYRFLVKGMAATKSTEEPYVVASEAFEVVAAPLAATSTATRGATTIDIQATLGAAPGLRALRVGPSDANVPLIGPWSVAVTLQDGQTKIATVMPDADGKAQVTLTANEVQEAASVEVRDPAGNGGALVVQ
ncbi:neutral/alkaline non-lysosomal ceramidase N-terminal domain-containing protein [Polyangium aurulentum]|uniref:neutral/alkaline non-lysosomal ceramidase N-terminal domain-containing protein n=1 Tax=Polyangium aurulentum TaxID=2567896 RepID=UPI0010AEBC50|nr:neutral/alkaline non-lysosomal ceramidase N-terminal domain-containing protein [Polyangium aurulentum]UQA62972.1 neutral/alkaline non-lysosomal ceramidase N-terminal domain-containing protein [Polyangium aurulentum]